MPLEPILGPISSESKSVESGIEPATPSLVLLVEDNLINQKVAQLMLNRLGYEVDMVGNGLEALLALARKPYSLILMDCQMPEMDGFAATRAIRASIAPYATIPIIALTANAFSEDKEEALAAGMNDFVTKPIKMELLAQILQRWLNRNAN